MSSTSIDKSSDKDATLKVPETADHVEDVRISSIEGDFDNSIDDTKPSAAVWMIVFTVAMGGFLFGTDYHSTPSNAFMG